MPFEEIVRNYLYNKYVFVLSPWQDIYITDEERKMSFVATIQFHEKITTAYKRHGYSLIEVPNGTVKGRSKFLREQLKSITGMLST